MARAELLAFMRDDDSHEAETVTFGFTSPGLLPGGLSMAKAKISNYPFGPFSTVIAGADFTNRGIKESGYFSINIPSSDMVIQTTGRWAK